MKTRRFLWDSRKNQPTTTLKDLIISGKGIIPTERPITRRTSERPITRRRRRGT